MSTITMFSRTTVTTLSQLSAGNSPQPCTEMVVHESKYHILMVNLNWRIVSFIPAPSSRSDERTSPKWIHYHIVMPEND